MRTGFILITTAIAKEKEVFNGISNVDGISEYHSLFSGAYDIIVKVEYDDPKKLHDVNEAIKTVDGVKYTKKLEGIDFK